MSDAVSQALAAARVLRASAGYASLSPAERAAFDQNLGRIEHALRTEGQNYYSDPYAVAMETPADLARGPMFGQPAPQQQRPVQPAPAPAAPKPAGTEVLGTRARQTLEAVDFPSFVAGLITGTFQAIVDATTQQIREYAQLVASIAQSVDSFSRQNVSPNQVRDWFVARHPQDLILILPKAGEKGTPKLAPRKRSDEGPAWLAEYGLAGREFNQELTEGALLDAGRTALAEERMQTLATMVLMGVNRIVVSDGQIKARLQFHASAKESVRADVTAQTGDIRQMGIAAQQNQASAAVQTMVSTVSVNAQADIAVRANLVGEVAIKFRSETFNLERFADSQAIELINRHSRLKQPEQPAASPGTTTPPAAP